MEKTSNIINELKKAAQAYYQEDSVLMTDEEYDTKLQYLENLVSSGELELTDELKELLYTSVSAGSKPSGTVVFHDYPMLSLAKAKNSEELMTYHTRLIKEGATGFRLEMKFDGLALSAKYESGKLLQLATRGDGHKGELLNYLIDHEDVSIVGLPKKLDFDYDFELRGELYITNTQFEVINKAREEAVGEPFSNSRNAVTGIIKGAEKGIEYKAKLTFTAYSVYHDGEQIEFNTLKDTADLLIAENVTKKAGGDTVVINSLKFDDLKQAVADFGELRKTLETPTDGVVIKPLNEIEMLNKLGFTSHHPVAYIAYKYPGVKAITTVEDIVVSVGKTGRLTPQARVKPVEIDGVTITNITCHNYSWLNTMGIRIGSTVAVVRANDVIPAIDIVIDKGNKKPVTAPTRCPECESILVGDQADFPKTLVCENVKCPSRLFYYMKSVVSRNYLYIEHLGDVILEALIKEGTLRTVADFFRLDTTTLANTITGHTPSGKVRRLGVKNAQKIVESIERAKEHTDSNKLLASLNIEGVGPNTAKRLIDYLGGVVEVLKATAQDILKVDQVGETLVHSILNSQDRALKELNELVELGVKISSLEKTGETKGTFSVSGSVEGFANRAEFVKHMESLGWEFHKSPKKNTDVLFADPNGTSNKIKKAVLNGTRIISKLEDL